MPTDFFEFCDVVFKKNRTVLYFIRKASRRSVLSILIFDFEFAKMDLPA